MNNRPIRVALLLMVMAVTVSLQPGAVRAQNNTITLKVAMPDYDVTLWPLITRQVIKDFKAAYPGVDLQLVAMPEPKIRTNVSLDEYLDSYRDYANAGDVVLVDSNFMPWTAFQAGYFLDLMPLVKADSSLNPDNFYPAVWQSFQMDNAMWALPTVADVLMLRYGQSSFDNREVAYPTEQWTREDIEKAAIALAERNRKTGAVKAPGLGWRDYYEVRALGLLRALLGENVYDSTMSPSTPRIDSPATEALLAWWAKLNQDGYADDVYSAPIKLWNAGYWTNYGSEDDEKHAVLLPGGKTGVLVEGIALSKGTQHPQEAYALAKFLTTRPEMIGNVGTASLARTAVEGWQDFKQANRYLIDLPPDIQASVEKILVNGNPASELRYMEYIHFAFDNMMKNNVDAATALLAAQDQAIKDMRHVAERKAKDVIVVTSPETEADLPPGKIALNFGIASTIMPLPNSKQWDDLSADFVSGDPQVAKVKLTVDPQHDIVKLSQEQDCFYLPYNVVSNLPAGSILNLDPLLDADKNFKPDDIVAGIMPQLQHDNKTWALPIVITPVVLKYNMGQFQKARLPLPTSAWTIEAFVDALKALKPSADAPAPFVTDVSVGGSPILMLIVAYGGLPLDYRTDPITVKFTDPQTVDAIQQVLDLAKQGYIKYNGLASHVDVTFGNPTGAPLYTELFSASNFRAGATYKAILFPKGSHSRAVSFSIGTGYISAHAQNPEACYRWLSTLAAHPEVLSAMPARRSLIATTIPTQGPDIAAFYQDLDTLAQDPQTVTVPVALGASGSPAELYLQHWLFSAFDNYVLHAADLNTQLKEAETYAKAFQECLTQIPDTGEPDSINKRFMQANTCALKVDPSLK